MCKVVYSHTKNMKGFLQQLCPFVFQFSWYTCIQKILIYFVCTLYRYNFLNVWTTSNVTHYKAQFPHILIAYVPKQHKHVTFILAGLSHVRKRNAYVMHSAISGGHVDDILAISLLPGKQTSTTLASLTITSEAIPCLAIITSLRVVRIALVVARKFTVAWSNILSV